MSETVKGLDGKVRCKWCEATTQYINYHDAEWGYPVSDDQRLFEKICLEGFQSGLSWRTILAKRDNFRKAFKYFDFYEVAKFTQRDINRLLTDKGIVRHKGKIEATINNAICAIQLVKQEGSLASFFWRYEPGSSSLTEPQTVSTTLESVKLAKDLKKLGWKFVGPTTTYAFMQAMGMVNDHAEGCVIRKKVERARKNFTRP
ncbi:MAG: DNA-3-methyladenine glycosylase I [Gammaproteobacteria bacterium]|nr:DNA-3-methyladenine glycosylase I [Gammaproteobacteria bacterium]